MSNFSTIQMSVAATIPPATLALMRDISRKKPVCCISDCMTIHTRLAKSRTMRIGVTAVGTVAADRRRNANNGCAAKISNPHANAAGKQHSPAATRVVRTNLGASPAARARVCPGPQGRKRLHR